jgi:XTP/dITP diphosphohydrolase
VRAPVKLFLASSNAGKLGEYRALARAFSSFLDVEIDLVPDFAALPEFEESAATFAENALGKALHYSRHCEGFVFADDSGLAVSALGGAPGVHSARFAGRGATDNERIQKLRAELQGKTEADRAARFVCAIALASGGRASAVVSGRADGIILDSPRGSGGFGYDPVFYFPPLNRTFAELSREEKNEHSHRGKAFRSLLNFLSVALRPA